MKSLEEFISKAKDAACALGEKAGQFASVSKLNLRVIEAKSNLRQEFEALGKTVYENYDDGLENKSEIADQVKTIKGIYEEIEKIKSQIAFMKNKILCKSCGNHNDEGSLFCSKCGENLKKEGLPIIDDDSKNDDFAEFDD